MLQTKPHSVLDCAMSLPGYQPPARVKNLAVGLPWYEAADYPEIRRFMSDGAGMPETFELWLQGQLKLEEETVAKGKHVCRVVIKPVEFIAWCEGFTLPNSTARLIYAAVQAKEMAQRATANTPRPAVSPLAGAPALSPAAAPAAEAAEPQRSVSAPVPLGALSAMAA